MLPTAPALRTATLACLAALLAAAPLARAGQLKGSVVLPPIPEDVDPSPEARPPLGAWRLENGRLRVAREADVRRQVVLALEPLRPARLDPPPLMLESRPGGGIDPQLTIAQLGVAVTWKNTDSGTRTVTLEEGDTLLPPEPTAPGGTRAVRFTIAGEYVFLDPDHPFTRATVVVVDTPYAAQADERGGFTIDAPDGKYRLRAWWRGGWVEVQTLDLAGARRDLVVRLGGDAGATTASGGAAPSPRPAAPGRPR